MFIIHGIPLDGELPKKLSCPFTELHGSFRIDLIVDSDDGREVVVIGVKVLPSEAVIRKFRITEIFSNSLSLTIFFK